MRRVNVQEAKTQLSRLLAEVESGNEVVIARAGVPVARLVPIEAAPRALGRDVGRIWIAPDFDAPLPEELVHAFEGDE